MKYNVHSIGLGQENVSKDIDFFHSREIYLLKTIGYC